LPYSQRLQMLGGSYGGFNAFHVLVQQSTPFLWAITMHGLQA
jgi:hypothetical protein